MTFNIIARNHDDHSKNFAFMLKKDKWSLAPAYDLAYSYKPGSKWVNSHWMSLNGKRDKFTRSDFYSLKKLSPIFSKKKSTILLMPRLSTYQLGVSLLRMGCTKNTDRRDTGKLAARYLVCSEFDTHFRYSLTLRILPSITIALTSPFSSTISKNTTPVLSKKSSASS